MNKRLNYFFTILLVILPFYSYAQSPDDAFMGDYEGIFTGPGRRINSKSVAEVFPLGNKEYFIHFLPAFNSSAEELNRATGSLWNNRIIFNNELTRGEISEDSLKGEMLYGGEWIGFKLKKVERSSPTEGAKPPKDAIVLFNGSDFSEWTGNSDLPVKWKIVNGNEMEVVPAGIKIGPKTNILTIRQFTDIFLHLEFKLSLMPESRKQQRCNSGLIFTDVCEVQILDSYGLEGYWNECGALCRNSPPKVNMCFPPLRWQTYDVIIHSPRYDQNGKRVKDAEITVFHNGKRIHYQYPVRKGPDQLEEGLKDFPFRIQLQDHNDVLWFRNIWASRGGKDYQFAGSLAEKINNDKALQQKINDNMIRLYKGKTPSWIDAEMVGDIVPTAHMKNFIDCVMDRSQPISDVFTAHRANTSAILAHSAMLLGRTLKWEPDKQEFVGDEQANQLLSRAYREPYQL